jgi:subtilisin family serine protease
MVMVVASGAWNQTWGYFPGQEKILQPQLIEEATKGLKPVRVIVTLKGYEEFKGLNLSEGKSYLSVWSQVSDAQEKVLSKLGPQLDEVGVRLKNIPIFAATVSAGGLKALAASEEVAFIEQDRYLVRHTAQGIPMIQPGAFRSSHGGKGIAIAIVDTGINYKHPAMGGGGFPNSKVIGGYDFGDGDADPMDNHGHGTNCAGVAAGLNTNRGAYIGGVAPEAKIYALKIAAQDGRIPTSALLAAWDWCVTHKNDDPSHPIKVISTSIGTPRYHPSNYCDKEGGSGAAVAANAVANGIAIFVSSGNEGMCNGIAFTSCLKDTIAVGAVYDEHVKPSRGQKQIAWCVHPDSCIAKPTGNQRCPYICAEETTGRDQVCCYSNSAQILDLLAPSVCAYVPSFPRREYNKCFGGTSAACPYTAGAAALIQSYFKQKTGKFLSVKDLRNLLTQNGDSIRDPKSGITKPRVNIERTIKAASPREEEDTGRGPVDQLRDLLRDSESK